MTARPQESRRRRTIVCLSIQLLLADTQRCPYCPISKGGARTPNRFLRPTMRWFEITGRQSHIKPITACSLDSLSRRLTERLLDFHEKFTVCYLE
jgi:hypothetical protein